MKSRYLKSRWPAVGVVVFALALAPVVDAAEPVVEADAMPGAFSGSVALTSEYFFRGISRSDDTDVAAGVSVPLGRYVELGFAVGRPSIEKEDVFGVPDYFDFLVSPGINIAGLEFAIAYTDTDLSTSACDDACGPVLFTVSDAF